MKILQVNSYYDYGSTGKIEKDINDYLVENGLDTYVCYAWKTDFHKKGSTKFFKYSTYLERCIGALITRVNGNRYGQAFFATAKLKRYIKKVKPDVVHLHCLNSYDVNLYSLLNFLKKNCFNVVITEHAEFYHTGNCPYAFECDRWIDGCNNCPRLYYATKSRVFDTTEKNWEKMKKTFDGFSNAVLAPVSGWLGERTAMSYITKDIQRKVVLNGINTDCFRYYSKEEISDEIKSNFTKKTVLFITSDFYSDVKGGKYILKLAEMMPEYNFIVICSAQVDCLGLPNVKHISFIKNQYDLAKYYSMADVTVLASKKETFSMPVAESLCCGTPIVGFYAGGPESIAIEEYSDFVEYGNTELLKQALLYRLNNATEKKSVSEAAIQKFSSNTMAKKYFELYKEIVNYDNNKRK